MISPLALLRLCTFAFALFALSAVDAAARPIRLAWDASADSTVTGYRVYWSTQPGTYNDADYFDVGNSLMWTGNLPGDQYYLAVRAYDATGKLGPLSLEVGDTAAFWLSNPGDQLSQPNQAVDFLLVAQGAAVTYAAEGLPEGLGIDAATGHIFGTLATPDVLPAIQVVTAGAADTAGHVSSVQFYWIIRTHQAPVVTNPGDQTNLVGDAIVLSLSALDPDGDILRYSATNLPPGLVIDATTGVISGTVAVTTPRVFNLSVAVSDGEFNSTAGFAWQIGPAGALAVVRTMSAEGTGSTVTTSPFSTTTPGETLIAFVEAAQPSPDEPQIAIVSGAGLQWALVARANAQAGTAEIWTAQTPVRLLDATVTAEVSVGGTFLSLTVVGVAGADGVGASATASAAAGAPGLSLTTTRAGSFVVGNGNDWDGAVSRTVPAGQELVHEAFSNFGDTFWVQRLAGAVVSRGTAVAISDTAPADHRWNLAAVEILARTQLVPAVALTPPVATPGTILSAAISDAPGNRGDWAGLFAVGADSAHFVAKQYLNGSTVPPATGVTSAHLSFTAPAQPGRYNVRLFVATNPAAPIAVSNTILVSSSVSIDDVSMTEGRVGPSSMVFTVTLSSANSVPVSVTYATADGTAKAGRDYAARSGTLIFPPGTTKQTITVTIYGDRLVEFAEWFSVVLKSATNAVIADSQAVGTILNDDGETRMFGFGGIVDGRLRDRFVFRVGERNTRDYGRLEFWSSEPIKGRGVDDDDRRGCFDDDYRRDHRAAKNRFESTVVNRVTFGPGDRNGQSVTFSGTGQWNGKSGFTFEAQAADHGEPGRGRDTLALVVKDNRGVVVMTVSATIDDGNIQSIPSSRR